MTALSRLTAIPLVVRAFVFVMSGLAVWLAAPAGLITAQWVLGIAVVALIPAIVPGSRGVGAVMILIIGLWVISTLAFGEEATVMRTFGAACALYLMHTGAALAAVLPLDAIVDMSVVLRWAARALLVLGAAGAITAFVVLVAPRMTPTESVLALLAALGAVALVITLLSGSAGLRRRM